MKVGFAKENINPPLNAPIVGYYVKRLVKGYLDNLYTRAVAFDDGDKKAILIAVDVCLLSAKYINAMKQSVMEKTGVEENSIFINCSHTHTGPVIGKDFASDLTSSAEYDAFLIESVGKVALNAVNDLKDAQLSVSENQAKGISFVRRYRMKNGYVATNPGVENPEIDHALAQPNEKVNIVKITRTDGSDICIFNFGTHPDTVGGEFISADWMGYACDNLEKQLPNTNAMFLLGPQGDVNHVNVAPTEEQKKLSVIDFDGVPRGIEHTKYMAKVLSDAVLAVYNKTEKVIADKINYIQKEIRLPSNQDNSKLEQSLKIVELYKAGRANELPYKEMELTTAVAEANRIVRLSNGPDSFPYLLSVVKIGELVFAGVGGEPFTEIGLRIEKASPFKSTIVCCLTNNSGGYIPTSKAYDEGGYEARGSSLKRGSDDILVEEMVNLLKSL